MAKGSDYGEDNRTLSFRLHPAELRKLQRLARRHGGVGRAIQVAIELLESHHKKVKLDTEYFAHLPKNYASEPQVLFSFSAPKRVAGLLAGHAIRYYDDSKNGVIRACVKMLSDIEDKNYYFDGPAGRVDDV